jgi:hypothetical protein
MHEEKPTNVVEYDDERSSSSEHVQLIGLPAVQSISDEQHRSDRHFAILQCAPLRAAIPFGKYAGGGTFANFVYSKSELLEL